MLFLLNVWFLAQLSLNFQSCRGHSWMNLRAQCTVMKDVLGCHIITHHHTHSITEGMKLNWSQNIIRMNASTNTTPTEFHPVKNWFPCMLLHFLLMKNKSENLFPFPIFFSSSVPNCDFSWDESVCLLREFFFWSGACNIISRRLKRISCHVSNGGYPREMTAAKH